MAEEARSLMITQIQEIILHALEKSYAMEEEMMLDALLLTDPERWDTLLWVDEEGFRPVTFHMESTRRGGLSYFLSHARPVACSLV